MDIIRLRRLVNLFINTETHLISINIQLYVCAHLCFAITSPHLFVHKHRNTFIFNKHKT